MAYLEQFDSFKQFYTAGAVPGVASAPPVKPEQTPKELIESAYQTIHDELAKNLLKSIMESSPRFFEKLVVDLLLAMGYGYDAETAETKQIRMILVDGAELTKLMIAHGVGVSIEHNYPVMQIDNDYFEE